MDKKLMNKIEDMEMDKVSGGRRVGGPKIRPQIMENIQNENGAMMPKPQLVVPIDPSTPKD